ncbi:kinase [Bacillus cereus]|uniref:Kinase n=1 Tax=Bacillus cereus TaxID=1396 RepID=A0A2B2F5P8_BACCE|nr:ROK family protein [Bacillus cereus]PEC82710.1 kinase [Bacillus cereus]PEQ48217.1 kinase [Bacillus cereus]PEX38882.1 kinase [Bacillus cereus]PFB14326.1 kinase [Bacillus cereus]PFB70457.1 kinase [Bacillus cereus]
MKKAVGIDIGGTKIAAGVISDTGELLECVEVKSDSSDREKMFSRVVKATEQVLRKSSISVVDIEGIGVGVPGKVDREEGIAVYQNNLPWRQFPITSRLQEQFSIGRITIDNDVYTAAFAEWKTAQGKKDETFVYVTISTGISCSIIHKGSFFRGAGFAGELGLIPVLSKGTNERLERIASGPGIQEIAKREANVGTIETKDVFTAYINGTKEYRSIINDVTDYLAQGLYTISCLMDPHKMVFGGSVIVNNPFLLELIKEKLEVYQLPDQQHILEQMSISTLAQNNGVVGAGLRVFEGM